MSNMYIKKNQNSHNVEKKKDTKPFNRLASFISLLVVIVAFCMVILPKKITKVKNETGITPTYLPYKL